MAEGVKIIKIYHKAGEVGVREREGKGPWWGDIGAHVGGCWGPMLGDVGSPERGLTGPVVGFT